MSTTAQKVSVAVVLSGCGYKDGSEVHEAVSTLLHLDTQGAAYQIFAPDKFQADVIDHSTGNADPTQQRHVISESNRIARGQAKPLAELNPADFAAVVFPGGNGAVKNLCNFAEKQSARDMEVDPDVSRVIRGFRDTGRPLAFCCSASIIAAKVLGEDGIQITLGEDQTKGQKMVDGSGARVIASDVTQSVVDKENRVVTSPAYMSSKASIGEVHQGIGNMINELLKMVQHTSGQNK